MPFTSDFAVDTADQTCASIILNDNSDWDGFTLDTATLKIYNPGSDTVDATIDLVAAGYVAGADITIQADDTTYGSADDTLEDGVYRFDIDIATNEGDASSDTVRAFSYCEALNCINAGMGAAASISDCKCESKKAAKYAVFLRLLYSAKALFDCGKYQKAQDIMGWLNDACENFDCGCD